MSGIKAFEKLLEKATSPLLFEIDWESIIKMCDLIRQGDVQPKPAIALVKKKLNSDNAGTVIFTLQVIESMVKNCGSKVHQEVATKDFMDIMRNLALSKTDPIKGKILELIQCWAHAFKKNPNYKLVEDFVNAMKAEGFNFPVLKESEAMFDVEEAPAWKEDSECQNCFKCRTEFTTLKRRHHCRACGQIFCHACSSKTAPIPKYGIEKEVRVCDLCYDKLKGIPPSTPAATAAAAAAAVAPNQLSLSASSSTDQLPIEYINSPLYKESLAATTKKPQEKSPEEFEEELQLALALSQSEAEAEEKRKKSSGNKLNSKNYSNSFSQAKDESTNESNKNRSKSWLTDSQSNGGLTANASAPYLDNSKSLKSNELDDDPAKQRNDEEQRTNIEIDEFVEDLKKTLELFINRMKSDSLRGRDITNDTAVQSLFLQLQHLHPKLMSYIKYQEDSRAYYENLQDKLTQLKDAREALNALRLENYEKKKRDNEERERIRQLQIAQKLQYMRQQKQSYYQYQNQLNLQRLQLQERDFQMRLEQQRQLVMKRDQNLFPGGNGLPYQALPNDNKFDYNSQNASMLNNIQMPYNLSGNMMPMSMQPQTNTSYPNVYVDSYQMNSMAQALPVMSSQLNQSTIQQTVNGMSNQTIPNLNGSMPQNQNLPSLVNPSLGGLNGSQAQQMSALNGIPSQNVSLNEQQKLAQYQSVQHSTSQQQIYNQQPQIQYQQTIQQQQQQNQLPQAQQLPVNNQIYNQQPIISQQMPQNPSLNPVQPYQQYQQPQVPQQLNAPVEIKTNIVPEAPLISFD